MRKFLSLLGFGLLMAIGACKKAEEQPMPEPMAEPMAPAPTEGGEAMPEGTMPEGTTPPAETPTQGQ